MERVTLDSSALAKLGQFPTGVKVCDDAGHVLGYFTPTVDPVEYQNLQMPQTTEELVRRQQESKGRSLPEIMRDLEKQS